MSGSSHDHILQGDGDSQARGKSTRLCRHFARGRCTWGDGCRFSHNVELAQLEQTRQQQQQQQQLLPQGGLQPQQALVGMDGIAVQQLGPSAPMRVNVPSSVMPRLLSTGAADPSWIGRQQANLQQHRHAVLMAGITGHFIMKLNSDLTGVVELPNISSADIPVTLLAGPQLKAQLDLLEVEEKVREGGLHYLVGESSVFWSLMRLLHTDGTTGSPVWDTEIHKAVHGKVRCMFYNSAAGCLASKCQFEHHPPSSSAGMSATMFTMATSNALLNQVPGLFGTTSPAAVAASSSSPNHNNNNNSTSGGNPISLSTPPPLQGAPSNSTLGNSGFVSITAGEHPSSRSSQAMQLSGQTSQSNWACVSGQAVMGSTSHLASLNAARSAVAGLAMSTDDTLHSIWAPASDNNNNNNNNSNNNNANTGSNNNINSLTQPFWS